MDLATGLTIAGTALSGAKVLEKFLGPTADYLGTGLKNWTEQRVKNLNLIFKSAINKTGDDINLDHSVPPKILKGILNEGSYCDDPIAAEYFGGVLASSRSGNSRDDRGAYYLAIINRLSSYQLRTHYIYYQVARQVYQNRVRDFDSQKDKKKLLTAIPLQDYEESMDFMEGEKTDALMNHIKQGLIKENLTQDWSPWGNSFPTYDYFTNQEKVQGHKVLFFPSNFGVELFFWSYGKPYYGFEEYFNPETEFPLIEGVKVPKGYNIPINDKNNRFDIDLGSV